MEENLERRIRRWRNSKVGLTTSLFCGKEVVAKMNIPMRGWETINFGKELRSCGGEVRGSNDTIDKGEKLWL